MTGRLRSGSIVMSGSTASQHAKTSRPFIRTAHVPHIFEPQNQRYAMFTLTSRQSKRSERRANTYPMMSIRIISTGSIEGRPMSE